MQPRARCGRLDDKVTKAHRRERDNAPVKAVEVGPAWQRRADGWEDTTENDEQAHIEAKHMAVDMSLPDQREQLLQLAPGELALSIPHVANCRCKGECTDLKRSVLCHDRNQLRYFSLRERRRVRFVWVDRVNLVNQVVKVLLYTETQHAHPPAVQPKAEVFAGAADQNSHGEDQYARDADGEGLPTISLRRKRAVANRAGQCVREVSGAGQVPVTP
mmetsp:Transcript_40777/g.92428  ORF Transcript_40777/g.92428 Transcript_40777/m.92428 type:complete len:217 (-) Transcript_40777:435-1085(-)